MENSVVQKQYSCKHIDEKETSEDQKYEAGKKFQYSEEGVSSFVQYFVRFGDSIWISQRT